MPPAAPPPCAPERGAAAPPARACGTRRAAWPGVLVAALLDFALRVLLGSVPGLGIDYDVLLCPLVTAWYLLTELGSIAENAGALGAPMPQFLMRAIAALRAGISDRGGGDGDGGGAA